MSNTSDIKSSAPPPPLTPTKSAAKRGRPKGVKSNSKKPQGAVKRRPPPAGLTSYVQVPATSLYSPEYCDKLIEHCAKGLSYESFAGVIDVCKRTLYAWETHYPQWVEAKAKAYAKALLYLEKTAIMGMMGKLKGFNAVALIYYTSNRLREDFRRNPDDIKTPEAPDTMTISQKTSDPIAASLLYEKLVKGK